MKHVIIGTAGHVDHGKTALIFALTGTNTDRLQEEKRRGISIELGFAAFTLTEDIKISFVDVPGHERYLKNMLAGTGGIDAAILVIAADEGVMPQTREHLAMMELLGVRHGIVVINKIDKMDNEWIDLVEEDIREFLSGTFLAHAPLCKISALSGAGLTTFCEELINLGRAIPARDTTAPFRMWIDRVFVSKGHGIVATGSILSGKVKNGDTLKVLPNGAMLRVRGLEMHGIKTETAYAGQRAAINLSGAEIRMIDRGMVLTDPNYGQVSTTWSVSAKWHQEIPSTGLRIRLHIGTAEHIGRIHYYKDSLPDIFQLSLEKPLGAASGDKGVIRLYSPQILLGGITLISPGIRTRKMQLWTYELAQAQALQELDQIVRCLAAREDRLLTMDEIQCMAGYFPQEKVNAKMQKAIADGWLDAIGEFYCARAYTIRLTTLMQEIVKQYHERQPYQLGMPREVLRQKLKLTEKEFEAFLRTWEKDCKLCLSGAALALNEHIKEYNDWQKEIEEKLEILLEETEIINITTGWLAEKLGLPEKDIFITYEALLASGVLIRVGCIIVYRKTMQYIAENIRQHFLENATLTVAEFRDKLNTSRKIAMIILEHFDMHKYTIRDGDIRRKGREVKYLSE